MTDMTDLVSADQNLKRKHRALWALGDYPAVAAELVGDLGPILVAACALQPGERVLAVAAGSGNAAIPAAKTGAHVVASDLTPELLAAGRRRADQQSVQLDWREADAEALPFDDDAFDVVLSCIGVMFAPHHQVSADELVRVCRPGGRLGLLSWTPTGFVGRLRRPAVRGDETVLRTAAARRSAATVVGRRRSCPWTPGRPGGPGHSRPANAAGRPVHRTQPVPRLLRHPVRPDDRRLSQRRRRPRAGGRPRPGP